MSTKTTTTHSVETSGSGTATLAELREFLAATEYWPGDAEVDTLHWLIEEFRVSQFAQELKTAEPVSAKRLAKLVATLTAPLR